MNHQKIYGFSILLGSVMGILTMALHPVGGSIPHLVEVTPIIVGTHALGIVSLPFMTFGFLGLTLSIRKQSIYADAAFVVFTFSNVAVLFAALFNGLVTPAMANYYQNAEQATLEMVRVTLTNNFMINEALDQVFIIGICVSAMLWSIVMIKSNDFPKPISIIGIFLGVSAILFLMSGFVFVDLTGFRIFIFGYVLWAILVGIYLIKKGKAEAEDNQ